VTTTATTGGPGWELFAQWHALIEQADPRFTMVSTVLEVEEALVRMVRSMTVSMWNMQRHHNITDHREDAPRDASLRAKGVELRFILPRRVAELRSPLASSFEAGLRLAPVAHPLMVCDRRWIVVGDATGETVWTSNDPAVVEQAARFYEERWRTAEPAVPPGEEPPFTERMVDIALLLVDGSTDREIARALGVSERTVSADVREMSGRLGARSRAHAIALISGLDG
jgi:DNA-binding CsgD family transcriptional regulator